MGGHVDHIEQAPRFVGRQHRRLAPPLAMRRPAHRRGGVHRHDMARHQPIEQVTDAGELLLDAGRGQLVPQRLDPGRDVEGLHLAERGDAARLTPGQEVARRARIGAPRVRVADRHREELKEAPPRGVVGRRDQRRQRQRGRGQGGELVHG